MDRLSDTQIRAGLRNTLVRHRIDLNKTSFVCARGVVRMIGELLHQREYANAPVRPVEVEALERDLNHVRGVQRVHFDLSNWDRLDSGEWRSAESDVSSRHRAARADTWPEVEADGDSQS